MNANVAPPTKPVSKDSTSEVTIYKNAVRQRGSTSSEDDPGMPDSGDIILPHLIDKFLITERSSRR